MNVGEINSDATNLLDLSCVLGGRLAGLNSEKLRTYHSFIRLPPPPNPCRFAKINAEVLNAGAAEKEANASMERSKVGNDPSTKCVHVSASIDGAYHYSSCFSSIVSTTTGKALANKVVSNSCLTCTRFQNKDENSTLSEPESLK